MVCTAGFGTWLGTGGLNSLDKISSGIIPHQITTDKEPGFANAIKGVFGPAVIHRDNKYLNNRMEANHRGLKSWYYPMKGFKMRGVR